MSKLVTNTSLFFLRKSIYLFHQLMMYRDLHVIQRSISCLIITFSHLIDVMYDHINFPLYIFKYLCSIMTCVIALLVKYQTYPKAIILIIVTKTTIQYKLAFFLGFFVGSLNGCLLKYVEKVKIIPRKI
jgi:hypothetical protein